MQEESIRRYGKKELVMERDGDVGNYNEFHVYDDGVHFYVQKINNILKQSRFKALKSHFEVKTIPFGPSHGLEWSWGVAFPFRSNWIQSWCTESRVSYDVMRPEKNRQRGGRIRRANEQQWKSQSDSTGVLFIYELNFNVNHFHSATYRKIFTDTMAYINTHYMITGQNVWRLGLFFPFASITSQRKNVPATLTPNIFVVNLINLSSRGKLHFFRYSYYMEAEIFMHGRKKHTK